MHAGHALRALALFSLGLVLAACGGGVSSASTTPVPSSAASASQFVQAIELVRGAHPDARIFEVEIDDDTRAGFLEVELFLGDVSTEVFVDPGTMAIVHEQPEELGEDERRERDALRAAFVASQTPDLRDLLAAGVLQRHAIASVQEVELDVIDGHVLVAVELLEDGARTVLFHDIDGSYLGTREEALAALAQRPPAQP